jgi:hypothetical protein
VSYRSRVPDQRREEVEVELAADRGGDGQRGDGPRVEPVDALGDELADGDRDVRFGRRTDRPPIRAAQELVQEERVPVGALLPAPEDLGLRLRPGVHADERRAVVRVEPPSVKRSMGRVRRRSVSASCSEFPDGNRPQHVDELAAAERAMPVQWSRAAPRGGGAASPAGRPRRPHRRAGVRTRRQRAPRHHGRRPISHR